MLRIEKENVLMKDKYLKNHEKVESLYYLGKFKWHTAETLARCKREQYLGYFIKNTSILFALHFILL